MRTKGWQSVFRFTFIQHIKTKSFIAGTVVICVIMALICVLTNVLPGLINEDLANAAELIDNTGDNPDNPDEDSDPFLESGFIDLFDDAGILAEEDKTTLSEMFPDRFSEFSGSELSEFVEELKSSERAEIAVHITKQTDSDGKITGYELRSYYTTAAKDSAELAGNIMSQLVNRRILLNAGVAPEKYADTQVSIIMTKTEAGGKNLSSVQGLVNYALPLVVSLVLFMLIYTYGSIVANSIATEKTSRVMELLLTSIRPLAIVIGKVLAMALVSVLQFALIIFVGYASFALSAPFGWLGKAMTLMKDPDIQNALLQAEQMANNAAVPTGVSTSEFEIAQAMNDLKNVFTPFNIVMIVIIFILGFLFYSLIAALVGASISRMEDLQAAMSPYAIIGILGMYLSYFPVMFNIDSLANGEAAVNPVQLFSYYFPISSPFALPSAVMLGSLGTGKTIAAVAILAAFVVLIAIVVSKVYEAIVLHNGNRIKLGDMLKIAVRK